MVELDISIFISVAFFDFILLTEVSSVTWKFEIDTSRLVDACCKLILIHADVLDELFLQIIL